MATASNGRPHPTKQGRSDTSARSRRDNGLLLRSDLHILFDRSYMTVTKDYRIEVSRRIKEEFDNGEEYYRLRGQSLKVLPDQQIERPSPEFIRWHKERVLASWLFESLSHRKR
jgi:predicted restriction endonuclease